MKSIQFKSLFFMAIMAILVTGCTKDSDASVDTPLNTLLAENFNDSNLTNSGWITYAQTGTKLWSVGIYKGDGYAQFSSYGSGQPVNVSWLISPALNMDNQSGEKLYFQSCQDGYVHSLENSLELYVSSDYDGVNFNNASWTKVNFTCPTQDSTKYVYVNSGLIDLSKYTGTLHFAFKVKGTTSLSGGYQIDNVRVFY